MLTTGYSHCFSGQLIWIFLWFILKMYIYFYEPDFFSFFTNNRQTRKCCNASFIHLHSSTVLSNIGMKKTKSFLVLSKQKFSFWNLLAKHNLMAIIKKSAKYVLVHMSLGDLLVKNVLFCQICYQTSTFTVLNG